MIDIDKIKVIRSSGGRVVFDLINTTIVNGHPWKMVRIIISADLISVTQYKAGENDYFHGRSHWRDAAPKKIDGIWDVINIIPEGYNVVCD